MEESQGGRKKGDLSTRTAEEFAIHQAPWRAESQLKSTSQKGNRSSALTFWHEKGSLKSTDYFTDCWNNEVRFCLWLLHTATQRAGSRPPTKLHQLWVIKLCQPKRQAPHLALMVIYHCGHLQKNYLVAAELAVRVEITHTGHWGKSSGRYNEKRFLSPSLSPLCRMSFFLWTSGKKQCKFLTLKWENPNIS